MKNIIDLHIFSEPIVKVIWTLISLVQHEANVCDYKIFHDLVFHILSQNIMDTPFAAGLNDVRWLTRGENWPQFFYTFQLLEKLWPANCFV